MSRFSRCAATASFQKSAHQAGEVVATPEMVGCAPFSGSFLDEIQCGFILLRVPPRWSATTVCCWLSLTLWERDRDRMTLCKGGAWIVLQKASPGILQQASSSYSGCSQLFFACHVACSQRSKKYNCWRIDLSKRLSGDVGRQWHNPYKYTKVE